MAAESLMEKAGDLFREGDFLRAESLYSSVLDIQPRNAKALSNRSAVYMKMDEFKKALKDADACTKADPSFPKGWARLGAALHALKHYEDAVNAYSKAQTLDQSNSGYAATIAELRALTADGRGVATDSNREEYYFKRSVEQATQAMKEGQYDAACRLYTKAIAQSSASSKELHVLYANRSAAQLKAGRTLEALDDAAESVTADPHYARAHVRLGAAHLARSELSAAQQALDRATALDPHNTQAAALLAELATAMMAQSNSSRRAEESRAAERAAIAKACESASAVDASGPRSSTAAPTGVPFVAQRHTVSYAYCRICSEYGHTSRDCPMKRRH